MDPAYQPITDPAAAYPAISAARQAMQVADWPRFSQIIEQAASWDERKFIMDWVDDPSYLDFLRSVMATQPNPLAATLLAGQLMDEGWRIRGSGWGSDVSQEQWRRAREYLDQAEQQLSWACAVAPGFVPAWVARITSSMALNLGLGESKRRHARVEQLDPDNFGARRAMMLELCPKWHGDSAAMNSFAAKCAQDAPEGSITPMLLVQAQNENALEVVRTTNQNIDQVWSTHFSRPDVRTQLRWAAQKSVLSAAFVRGPRWVQAMSFFAVGLAFCEDWSPAKYCFAQLGPYADYGALTFVGGEERRFAELRQFALERG